MTLSMLLALIAALATATPPASPPVPSSDAEHYLDGIVDRNADPRVDFFKYAVGGWLAKHPIPPSERSWGIAHVVQEETYRRLIEINENAASSGAPAGNNAQKIGDFWFSAMDTVAIGQQSITPLGPEFDRIAAVSTRAELLDDIAHLQYIGVDAMGSTAIFQDEMNSERYLVHLYQGGLGMPDRDYYFDQDERGKKLRTEYVRHVQRMFELLGDPPAKAKTQAATVMAMETDLARASRKLEDLRDPRANYHAMSVDSASALTPSIPWRTFLEHGEIRAVDTVVVGQPEFFQQVEKSLKGRSLADWKTYLRWHLVHSFASEAGGRFDAENFHYYGTILNGTPQQRPRWKRALDFEEDYLGDALGQLYVQRYFTPHDRERYELLTGAIFDAFSARIQKLDWMSAETKQRALKKLAAVTKKVGYPQKWRDYSKYQVERGSFLTNCMRGNVWLSDFYIAKLNKPVDRTEWDMTPQTYNAYYNDSNNEIVLPAAAFILPGIADSLVDDALVYGYAGGTTIGHEITHGFDDNGRQFDERGNLENWWTAADEKEFKRRAAGIIRQFDAYVATGTLHVNGKATQGENIADLGGIVLAWDAFTKTREYQEGKSIGGFTPAQRYFIGWALGWMQEIRPEYVATLVKTNVHSPSFLRVIGPVTNQTEFYRAYDVRPGDPMYRPDSTRVVIW